MGAFDAQYCKSVFEILKIGVESGFKELDLSVPVKCLNSNNILLGGKKDHLGKFCLRLLRHPSGSILTSLYSQYGLSVPTPLDMANSQAFSQGSRVDDVKRPNYERITVVSSPDTLNIFGTRWDGDTVPIRQICSDSQKLFIAQISGAVIKNSLR
jgi:hypothetical protein